MFEERIKYCKAFIFYLFKRFAQNRCSSIAAELTVTSLLALVPLSTVIFALLALIPSFQSLAEGLQTLLFKYFVPGTGETVQHYINEFVGKARDLSGVGTLMLFITALLMMRTIDNSFNKIWHVKSNQSMVRTLLVYWAVLTLGPILVGSSLLITSYIQSLPMISDVVSEHGRGVTLALPFLMENLAFSVMFFVIPNQKIKLLHAIFSGTVTAILFEIAKSCFAIFVSSFSTYQVIFGALAAVPLFLIWIYLCWGIVLLGAEFCHALGAFELPQTHSRSHPFVEVVNLLLLLAKFQKQGKRLTDADLNQVLEKGQRSISRIWIEKMVSYGLVCKAQDQTYCLVGSADKIDYWSIYQIVDRHLPSPENLEKAPLPETTKKHLISFIKQVEAGFSGHLVVEHRQEKPD